MIPFIPKRPSPRPRHFTRPIPPPLLRLLQELEALEYGTALGGEFRLGRDVR